MSTPRGDTPLVLLLAGAAVLRVWSLDHGLPHTLTRPDEEAVLSIALNVSGGHFNPGFFDWPSLFIYMVAAAFAVASFIQAAGAHYGPLYLIARSLSAGFGIATVAVVYRTAAHLFDRTTAIIAAAYLAVAALHVRESHVALTDIAATCLLSISFVYTVRYARSAVRRDALLSALWAGLAASTKYNAAIVMLPAVWLIVSRRDFPLLAGYLLVSVAAFVAGTPYALLDSTRFLASLRAVSAHLQGGHIALAGYAWRTHLTSSLRYGIGLPMLLAGLAGFALLIARRRRDGVLLALCPVAYFLVIGAGQTAFARYILPTIPFLCIAAAYATMQLARVMRPAAPVAAAWLLAAAIAAPSLVSAIQTNRLLARTDNRVVAADWIARHAPPGSRIFQGGSLYTRVQVDERYRSVPIDAAPDLIVVARCPLAYCAEPPEVTAVLSRYTSLVALNAVDQSDPRLVYDLDDAFFVPLSGFSAVTRPGPNIDIYRPR